MHRLTQGRERLFLAVCIVGGIAILLQVLLLSGVQAASLSSARVTVGAGDWPTYIGNNQRIGYNGAEATLNATSVARLKLHWKQFAANGVSVQPIEANGVVYWGSWDGFLHAFTIAGRHLWDTQIGTTSDSHCNPSNVGVASTATYGAIGATPVIFVGGGNARFYALNASNGHVVWSTSVGPSPSHFIWSSPLVANGSVYIGVSSFGDCPIVQGQLIKFDATTGSLQADFKPIRDGCSGNGIWSSPSLEASGTTIYVTTGNPGPCAGSPGPYGESVVALNASTLGVVKYWSVPQSQRVFDSDFGATPTLFDVGTQHYLGAANKNGYYYLFNRDNLSAGPLWERSIARSGGCPECGDGSIASSAWDGSRLYVAGGKTNLNGIACKGSVRALNPANGAVIWTHCLQSGPVLGPLTVINGVVIATQGQDFNLLNSATGANIISYHDDNRGSVFYGSASVSNGQLFVGNLDGNLYVFGL